MFRRFGLAVLAVGLIGTFSSLAFAWPPIFGPEWEFTDRAMQVDDISQMEVERAAKRTAMVALVEAKCRQTGNCTTAAGDKTNSTRVTYTDGWWFQIANDPSTVEIQAKPESVERFQELSDRIRRDVFEAARSVGLATFSEEFGGGHIHIDLVTSGMKEDPLLLRNFIVDFFNHHELATGVLEDDDSNAPAISLASDEVKQKLRQIVADFDKSGRTQDDVDQFIKKIGSDVYASAGNTKYQALNLAHITGLGTLEIRSLRMQRNIEEFILMTNLFQARIAYLKALNKPVPMQNLKATDSTEANKARFRRYVVESGLNWRDYERILNADYREVEINPFYSGAPHPGMSEKEYQQKKALNKRGELKPGSCETALQAAVSAPVGVVPSTSP